MTILAYKVITDGQLKHMFIEVSLGRGRRGDFLRKFAEAVLHADDQNFAVLRPAAKMIASHHNLEEYLDTYNG